MKMCDKYPEWGIKLWEFVEWWLIPTGMMGEGEIFLGGAKFS